MERSASPGAPSERFPGATAPDADDEREARQRRMVYGESVRPLLGLLLMVNLAMSLYQLPLNRVIERRLCLDFYGKEGGPEIVGIVAARGEIDEELCKIGEVQQGLARIQQVMDIAWILGDMIMTIPLGFVAEKYGRRVVLLMNLFPRIAMLSWAVVVDYFDDWVPVQAIVAASFLSFLGGDCIFNSIAYALTAGLTEDTVTRAKYFGYMSSISYIVNLAGPTLASATMSILLWLPFGIGIVLLFFAARLVSRIPDGTRRLSFAVRDEEQARLLDTSADPTSDPVRTTGDGGDSKAIDHATASRNEPGIPRTAFEAIKRRFRVLGAVLTNRTRNFTLLLFSMFLTSLASADTKLLVQYISKRYSRTFVAAGYILSCKAVVNFVLLTIVVPSLLEARSRRRLRQNLPDRGRRPHRRGSRPPPMHPPDDDRLARGDALVCLGISIVGALAVGMAANLWTLIPALFVYALGSALPIFTFSLLKSPQVSPSAPAAPGPLCHPAGPCPQEEAFAQGGEDGASSSSPTQALVGASAFEYGEDHDTTVFSIVMLVKTVGSLVGVPIVTSAWIRGIDLGGASLGLPYVVSAACYGLAIAVVAAIEVD